MHRVVVILAGSIACGLAAGSARADVWPRFRGANGDGQAPAVDVPSDFTPADYAWRTPLPGIGHSSPVVWDDRVIVTSGNPDTGELMVMRLDLATGDQQWQRRFPAAKHGMHAANTYATATPAVDADHIYIAWRDGDVVKLAALTHNGNDAWQAEVGTSASEHGFGTSPMVVGDVVCMTNDCESAADSAIVGFDRRTGDELWRQPCAPAKTSFATPCEWRTPDGKTLILMSTMGTGLTAYEPTTGAIAWNAFAADLPDRCVSSPIVAGDMVLISCGSGNNGKHLIGARLGAAADVPTEVYRLTQAIPNIPTPLVVGDMIVLWYDRGVVTAIDRATGETHWRERVAGNYHCSPVLVGDRIFGISLEGEVSVLAASETYQLLARVQLGERVTATPAVADGRLLIRTEESLISLGGKR